MNTIIKTTHGSYKFIPKITVDRNIFTDYEIPIESIESVILSKKTTKIEEGTFANIPNLKSVEAPSVTHIGQSAFICCTSLEKIDIPHILSIDEQAFASCENLKNVSIENVEYLGDFAFAQCKELRDIKLLKLDTIEPDTFSDCLIKELELPKNLKHIRQRAFRYTQIYNLKIPDTVENIRTDAFGSVHSENVYVPSRTKLSPRAFEFAHINNLEINCKEFNLHAFVAANINEMKISDSVENLVVPEAMRQVRVKTIIFNNYIFKDKDLFLEYFWYIKHGMAFDVEKLNGIEKVELSIDDLLKKGHSFKEINKIMKEHLEK